MNVPSKQRAKETMQKNKTVFVRWARNLRRTNAWSWAVMRSQGTKDEFSTGSQNHQPPQPSSL